MGNIIPIKPESDGLDMFDLYCSANNIKSTIDYFFSIITDPKKGVQINGALIELLKNTSDAVGKLSEEIGKSLESVDE